MMMRWDELNWERQEWRIPHTKNGEVVTIPLTEKALQLLTRRHSQTKSEWVFPRNRNTKKHLVYYRQQWARVLQKASLQIWANDPNLSHLIVPDDLRIISPKEVDDVFKKVTARTKHGHTGLCAFKFRPCSSCNAESDERHVQQPIRSYFISV